MVDSDLCFLTKDEIRALSDQYPELEARLNRLATAGQKRLKRKKAKQADVDTLVKRVSRRDTRPLLRGQDPRSVLQRLLEARTPAYAEADIHVDASAGSHQTTLDLIMRALEAREAEA